LERIIREYGVDVVAISPSIFKCDVGDAAAIKRHLTEKLPRLIEFAEGCGTNLVIIFGFIGKISEYDKYFDQIVDMLRKAADYAAEKGILLALENEPICFADTGERSAKLVKAVQRKKSISKLGSM